MIYTYSIANDITAAALGQRKLHREIQALDSVTIGLKNVSITGDTISIEFKAAISAGEKTALDALVLAHDGVEIEEINETIKTISELPQGGMRKTDRGFKFTAAFGVDTEYTYSVIEELYIKGGVVYTECQHIHDSISMKIIDKTYIYAGVLYPAEYSLGVPWSVALPNGVPIHEYIKDWPVSPSGETRSVNDAVTEVDLNGLDIVMIYHSIGTQDVKCNVGIEAYS